MIIPNLEALARDFWAGTNGHDTYPREIEPVISLKLPLVIAKQARINAQTVKHWL